MVLRRSGQTLVVQVLQLAAMAGIAILLTRAAGAAGLGRYTLLSLLAQLATLASGLGISWAAIHHVGAGKHELSDIVSTVLGTALASGVVAVALVGASYLVASHTYFREVTQVQIGLALVAIPLLQLNTAAASVLLGANRPVRYALLNLIQFGIAFVLQSGLAAAGLLSASTGLAAWVAGILVSLTVGLALLSTLAPLGIRVKRAVLIDLGGYGFKGYMANVAALLNYRIDSLLVNGFVGIVALGYYSVAVAMAETVWYVANATSLVMFPLVSSLSRAEADRITPKVCRNTLLATALAAIVLFLASRPLLRLFFTDAMAPALQPLWLLLPGAVCLSVGKVIASYLSGIGRPVYATWIATANVGLTVILDVILIPRFGIAGAAAATSIVYIVLTAASIVVFMRESGRGFFETVLPQREDPNDYVRLIRSLRGNRPEGQLRL